MVVDFVSTGHIFNAGLSSYYKERFGSQSPEEYQNLRLSHFSKSLASDEIRDVLLDAVGVVGDGVEILAAFGGGEVPRVIEGFGGEFFFAFEMPVDTAFFETGSFHDGLDGTAFVTALVEDRCGFGDDALARFLAFR